MDRLGFVRQGDQAHGGAPKATSSNGANYVAEEEGFGTNAGNLDGELNDWVMGVSEL